VRMYQKLNIRPLGLIENMSHFECPACGTETDLFGRGAGEALAADMSVPFLGRLPIYQPIRVGGDTGHPIVVAEPDSTAARAFRAVAEQAAAQVSIASYSKVIPLTPVR
jgi:ATP-binding protein involved in chromosome partitioning